MSSTVTPTLHAWRPSSARLVVLDGFVPVPRGTLPATPATLSWPAKDPSDVLDYEFDVSAALAGNEGDMIASVTVTVTPNGGSDLVLNSVVADGARAVMWFGGGQAGIVYTVGVTIVTATGRTIGRSVLLPVLALSNVSVPAISLTTDQGAVITDQDGNPILLGS